MIRSHEDQRGRCYFRGSRPRRQCRPIRPRDVDPRVLELEVAVRDARDAIRALPSPTQIVDTRDGLDRIADAIADAQAQVDAAIDALGPALDGR
jgi:hypothetical protein